MVIIRFPKDNFLNLTPPSKNSFDNGEFIWSKLGKLVVKGGLPKTNEAYDLDLQEIFTFVEQVDAFNIGPFEVSRKSRVYEKSNRFVDMDMPPISGFLDCVDHPYYKQLLFLRNSLKSKKVSIKLLVGSAEVSVLKHKIKNIEKDIFSLELDLRLEKNQMLLVNLSERLLKPKNIYLYRRQARAEKSADENNKRHLIYGVFPLQSAYEFNDIKRFKPLSRSVKNSPRKFDPLFWFLSYNKFFFSLNQNLNVFRNRLNRLKLISLNSDSVYRDFFN